MAGKIMTTDSSAKDGKISISEICAMPVISPDTVIDANEYSCPA